MSGVTVRVCAQCGASLPAGGRSDKRYCSKPCYNEGYRTANRERLRVAAQQRYLTSDRGSEARRAYNAERARAWRASNPAASRAASHRYRQKNLDKELARKRDATRSWREKYPDRAKESARRWAEANPDAIRAIANRKYHKRRAAEIGAFVENVDRDYIFNRDAYRCHLCGCKTLKSKRVPHPRAPTLDHIIPLHLGGTHENANVATACFLCNSGKGPKPLGDPILFG